MTYRDALNNMAQERLLNVQALLAHRQQTATTTALDMQVRTQRRDMIESVRRVAVTRPPRLTRRRLGQECRTFTFAPWTIRRPSGRHHTSG
jgi:hypothetical protein